jgi:putative CocE/NonD family hydrolase
MVDKKPSDSWGKKPQDYIKKRPIEFEDSFIFSQYVSVRDGTRLAVDIHVPGVRLEQKKLPVIIILTPYYRRFALRAGGAKDKDPCPTIAFYRDMFVPRGYVLVCVDIRGSGASYGCRDGFRSPQERLDHYDITEWISQQPWCDGNIGATGISYPGAAADFLASTNHEAVKAVAPLFAVWDTWLNHLYPGGILLSCVTKNYGQLAVSLDQDRRDLIPQYAYFKDNDLAGSAAVDEDHDGELLADAIKEHIANFDMQDFSQQLRFRDSGLTDNPEYTSASISPYNYANREADDSTAYYCISGWMDGGGYSTGTIDRYNWLKNPETRLLLGPWDHGARAHASPWRELPSRSQQPIVGASVLRFFDKHLKGLETDIESEKRVHYFTMGSEQWQASDIWPPQSKQYSLYAEVDHKLHKDQPTVAIGEDDYKADYSCGTGFHSRYDRLYIQNVETYYDDWDGREEQMLCYTGAPLKDDIEVTGHPVVELKFSCSERDCSFYVYLSEITNKGKSVYVTEGVFRALHRKQIQKSDDGGVTRPTHTFKREDAELLVPHQPAEVCYELLPTSYLFRKGNRIRFSLALADGDHFSRIPDGRPPRVTIYRNHNRATRIILPIVT